MNTLIQADIFFFITSVVVILGGILVITALIFIVLILKDFRAVSLKIRQGAAVLAEDVSAARDHIKEKGASILSTMDFFKEMTKKPKGRHRSTDK
jgi:hypothetical protein